MSALVRIEDDRAVADSRDVAADFGKQHKHVLRSIDAMLNDNPDLAPNFGPKVYPIATGAGGTRHSRCFDMDRKGFMLLVMGFQGAKALTIKSNWIDAFDQMERRLQQQDVAILPAATEDDDDYLGTPEKVERAKTALAVAREIRVIFGRSAAARVWARLGLPDPGFTPTSGLLNFQVPDSVGQWMGQRLRQVAEGDRIRTRVLHGDYEAWCRSNGQAPISLCSFGKALVRGGVVTKRIDGSWAYGVALAA